MVKKILITTISLASISVAVVFLYNLDQSRSIYCISSEKCITVWKRLGGKCYIVPEKYYGRKRPTGAYLKTSNTDLLHVIWQEDNSILVTSSEKSIYTQSTSEMEITLYEKNEVLYDSLFTYLDGNYRKYKKGVRYLSIDVKENYVRNNEGQKVLDLID